MNSYKCFLTTEKFVLFTYVMLESTGWTTGVRFPAGAGKFSLRHRAQTGPPSFLSMGTSGYFIGDKAAGSWRWPLTFI